MKRKQRLRKIDQNDHLYIDIMMDLQYMEGQDHFYDWISIEKFIDEDGEVFYEVVYLKDKNIYTKEMGDWY